MFPRILILALILAAPMAAHQEGKGHEKLRAQMEALRRDTRLQKSVSLAPRTASLAETLREIGRQSDVQLYTRQGGLTTEDARAAAAKAYLVVTLGLAESPTVAACRDVPAAVFLGAVAVATGALWQKSDRSWVLVETPELERFAALPWNESRPEYVGSIQPLKDWSPAQVDLLASGRAVGPADLSPVQRHALWLMALNDASSYGDIAPEALQLKGVYLSLRKVNGDGGPQQARYDLDFMFPRLNGEVRNHSSLPVFDLPVVPVPTRLAPRVIPPATPCGFLERPGRYETEPVDFQLPELQKRLRRGTAMLWQVAEAVARESGINLVLSTGYHYRVVHLSDEPAPTVATALRAIERDTGGRWRKWENVYVLETDPTLERLSHLAGHVRKEWQRLAALDVLNSLSPDQRFLLRENGKLQAHQLSSRQQPLLKWLATVAFSGGYQLAPDALRLKGVEIVYVRADDERALPAQVFIHAPAVNGLKMNIANVPIP